VARSHGTPTALGYISGSATDQRRSERGYVPGTGHQHPHSDRNGDHVAARTARSTAAKLAGSISGETRTVAAPITISITGDPAARAGGSGSFGTAASSTNSRFTNLTWRSERKPWCKRARKMGGSISSVL
jgi:hypothetical protein